MVLLMMILLMANMLNELMQRYDTKLHRRAGQRRNTIYDKNIARIANAVQVTI